MKKILSLFLIIALCLSATIFLLFGIIGKISKQPNITSTSNSNSQTTKDSTSDITVPDIPTFDSVFDAMLGSTIVHRSDFTPKLSEDSKLKGYISKVGANTPFTTKNELVYEDDEQIEAEKTNENDVDYTESVFPDEPIEFIVNETKYTLQPLRRENNYFVYLDFKNSLYGYMDTENFQFQKFSYNEVAYRKEDSNPNLQNCEAEVLKLAKKYASYFIDTSDYTLSYSVVTDLFRTGNTDLYRIDFIQSIQGYKTGDKISMQITSKGTLVEFSVEVKGIYDNIPQNIDVLSAEEFAKEKICKQFIGREIAGMTVLDASVSSISTKTLGYDNNGYLFLNITLSVDLTVYEHRIESENGRVKTTGGIGTIRVYPHK